MKIIRALVKLNTGELKYFVVAADPKYTSLRKYIDNDKLFGEVVRAQLQDTEFLLAQQEVIDTETVEVLPYGVDEFVIDEVAGATSVA